MNDKNECLEKGDPTEYVKQKHIRLFFTELRFKQNIRIFFSFDHRSRGVSDHIIRNHEKSSLHSFKSKILIELHSVNAIHIHHFPGTIIYQSYARSVECYIDGHCRLHSMPLYDTVKYIHFQLDGGRICST